VIARERGALHDAVFALGGDGTAMEVLPVLGEMQRPVGLLPGGTGNLIARALGIPLSVGRAVRVLLGGRERTIDLGILHDGRAFAFAAGVGIDVRMLEYTPAHLKRRFGVFAYIVSGTRAALAVRTFRVDATVDGERHTFQAAAALVTNFGSVLGGLFHLGPAIVPDDGVLDLCVFAPRTLTDTLRLGWRILRRDFAGASHMHFLRGREIHIETTPVQPAQADGELIGPTPLTCRVAPGAARVLVPGSSRRA
jgi:YegS/Rv2252/BmrU family lipid kinase